MVFLDYKTVAFSGNGTKYVTEYKSLIVAEFSNITWNSGLNANSRFYFQRSGNIQYFHQYYSQGSFISGNITERWENTSASHVIPAGVAIISSNYVTLTGIFHIFRLPE